MKLHILAFDSMPALVERLNGEPEGSCELRAVTMDPTVKGFCAVIAAPDGWVPTFADEVQMVLPDSKILFS